jgi:RND superfamily putative drug exporter
MASAIFIDATVVRLLLVPAVMHILGRANWWLPAWLATHLPQLHVEGRPELHLPRPEAGAVGAIPSQPTGHADVEPAPA